MSPDFEARLLAKLGRGGACPHGNLSELESPASRRRRGLLLLADAEAGKHYLVTVFTSYGRLLEFLEGRGVRPGSRVHVAGRNYDQMLTLTTDAGSVALGRSAAEKVWVTAEPGKARRTSSNSSS